MRHAIKLLPPPMIRADISVGAPPFSFRRCIATSNCIDMKISELDRICYL